MNEYLDRWHDAGTYDVNTKTGGPNGSIRNEHELGHGANSGLKIAINFCGELFLIDKCSVQQIRLDLYSDVNKVTLFFFG